MKRLISQPASYRVNRGGTAAIELAIVLPVLLLLVFGAIDFGRVAYYATALDNAVGCGAQYAATHRFTEYTVDDWETRVRDKVSDEMQGVNNFERNSLRTEIATENTPGQGIRVTVTATYPFQTIVDWPGLPRELLLRHRVSAWQYQ